MVYSNEREDCSVRKVHEAMAGLSALAMLVFFVVCLAMSLSVTVRPFLP